MIARPIQHTPNRIESGPALPHSRTLARTPMPSLIPTGLGVRLRSAALDWGSVFLQFVFIGVHSWLAFSFSAHLHFPARLLACLIIHSNFFGLASAPYTSGTPLKYPSNRSGVTSVAYGLDASHSENALAVVANRIAVLPCSSGAALPVYGTGHSCSR